MRQRENGKNRRAYIKLCNDECLACLYAEGQRHRVQLVGCRS